MNKLVIKEIKPNKKHKCQEKGCIEFANDYCKYKGKKLYLCENHLIKMFRKICK